MLRTLVVSWDPAVLSCCCLSCCSLYLPCESACSSRWSSDVIASTLMLTAACVSLQGADCGGILSLLPPPRSQPHLTFLSTTTSCLHLWLPVMIGFDIPTNPGGSPAGHCPFFPAGGPIKIKASISASPATMYHLDRQFGPRLVYPWHWPGTDHQ